jgi:hypothetical protein
MGVFTASNHEAVRVAERVGADAANRGGFRRAYKFHARAGERIGVFASPFKLGRLPFSYAHTKVAVLLGYTQRDFGRLWQESRLCIR